MRPDTTGSFSGSLMGNPFFVATSLDRATEAPPRLFLGQ